MSANGSNNTCDKNGNCKFIRAVEEAFFLLDRDHNRSVNSDDFCAIAKSLGKISSDILFNHFVFSF
jgi:Ca2+-binding EF-hand superfamily protein